MLRLFLVLVGSNCVSALRAVPNVDRRTATAGAFAAALLPALRVAAEVPSWDPHNDFLVGAEKNAISDYEVVPQQQATSSKLDINNAVVTDYKAMPGMYPHAAGLIASNGPYTRTSDIFKLPSANDRDKALFKKYLPELTVLPPGRGFYERINARQST